ncbi:hypothetical protein RR46_08018 [Papilio xuthus]|uniref:Uncharacterized protein n=1 Tax=Papilio xuthus TaxID=66420 RepID=A0A194QFH5_PAPXU|nr:hypothetical protein RR46_08018 [Papilio xuthus]
MQPTNRRSKNHSDTIIARKYKTASYCARLRAAAGAACCAAARCIPHALTVPVEFYAVQALFTGRHGRAGDAARSPAHTSIAGTAVLTSS